MGHLKNHHEKLAKQLKEVKSKINTLQINERIAIIQANEPFKIKKTEKLKNEKTTVFLFSDHFANPSNYKRIMDVLVEEGYCKEDTFYWIDGKKGNKAFLAAIIKHLHSLGYYKNKQRPSSEQIRDIALQSFGLEIAIDTIKRASPEQFDLSFIPSPSDFK
jgi:hypothetical protein